MNNRKITMAIIGIAIGLVILVGTTYAFFNYTRTGGINNIGTGRIFFNTNQTDTINMTNVFPMTSTEAENANLDSLTLTITGDTTYDSGEEYLISFSSVNNTINGKKIPISYIATVNNVGNNSNNYWGTRGGSTNTYTINSTGNVTDDGRILMGYITNGATGINGTLTIKAYVDASRIAITDTLAGDKYVVNTSMDSTALSECVSYLNSLNATTAFCNGTGSITISGDTVTFQEALDGNKFTSTQLTYLENHGIIIHYTNGTTSEWVNGREVFTTDEWNSLATNGLSFKVRAESNEGLWLNIEDSCFVTEDIDSNNIKIKGYARETYNFNQNITPESINTCVNFLIDTWGPEVDNDFIMPGETYQGFCSGTTTLWDQTFYEWLDPLGAGDYFYQDDIEYLIENGVVIRNSIPNSCKTASIDIPAKINNKNVTEIGSSAFIKQNLTAVTIPEGVTIIGVSSFFENHLTNVTIPNSVTTIGGSAFSYNDLTSVTIGTGVTSIDQMAFMKSDDTNSNLASITINKPCSSITSMNYYPWLGYYSPYTGNYSAGTTIYGSNGTTCNAY